MTNALRRTENLLLVLVELHLSKRLDENLDEDDTAFMPRADALHKPRISYATLVLNVLQLGNVDAGCASSGRRQREALAHDVEYRGWYRFELVGGRNQRLRSIFAVLHNLKRTEDCGKARGTVAV